MATIEPVGFGQWRYFNDLSEKWGREIVLLHSNVFYS
jgi:hypothetical protein